MKLVKFFLTRILIWVLTIWVGVSIVFVIQRMMPSDPIESMIAKMTTMGTRVTPEEIDATRATLQKQFGLDGTLWEQYMTAIGRMLTFDFGPSLSMYPTRVMDLISASLPYTVSLLLFTTLFSWIAGNAIGLLAGFKKDKWYSKLLETVSICIYPTPYFIMALVFIILFCYINKWFPLMATLPATFSFSWEWLSKVVYNSFLPALSLILLGCGWWIISMKSLSSNVAEEDFVSYGRMKGLSERTIGYRYVFRNSILTQVTALGLHLGGVFSGSLMTEIFFGYPGVGMLLQNAITSADYNLMLGLITISIFAVSTATLIIDLIYPFLDPRIRYS